MDIIDKKEDKILRLLYAYPNRVFSKFQLYERILDDDCIDWNNGVVCQIYQLRRKIGPDPAHPIFIGTVRDYGYKFITHEVNGSDNLCERSPLLHNVELKTLGTSIYHSVSACTCNASLKLWIWSFLRGMYENRDYTRILFFYK